YHRFVHLFSLTLKLMTLPCKAAGCGEAARLPFLRNGKYKTARFCQPPSDRQMKPAASPPD
ncbi:MAG: hypothetical protein ACI4SB_08620, partial [Acutalibacteraceae bacterium]